MDVTLIRMRGDGEDKTVVCVCDTREGAIFLGHGDDSALDVDDHPFAYRDFSMANYEDSCIAA